MAGGPGLCAVQKSLQKDPTLMNFHPQDGKGRPVCLARDRQPHHPRGSKADDLEVALPERILWFSRPCDCFTAVQNSLPSVRARCSPVTESPCANASAPDVILKAAILPELHGRHRARP